MTDQSAGRLQDVRAEVAAAIAAHRNMFLVEGVIIAILGVFAVLMPFITSLAVEIMIGWLFIAGGLLRGLALMRAKHMPGYWWSMLGAILAIALGIVLVARPLQGVVTLTMVLVGLFLIEGFAAIFSALDFRHHMSGWGWTLFSGIVDLVLAFLIWQGWPASSAWVIGLLTGINLFFLGLSLVMLALAAPKPASS